MLGNYDKKFLHKKRRRKNRAHGKHGKIQASPSAIKMDGAKKSCRGYVGLVA